LTSPLGRDTEDDPDGFRFADYSDALASIVDEGEGTWLFRVLGRSSPSGLSHLLPIIEWMENHQMLEKRPTDKRELLLKLERRAAKIAPYSTVEQSARLIERVETRHERRIATAAESGDLNDLQAAMESFFIVNKLAVWAVGRGLQNVEHLRIVRTNLERVFIGEDPLLGKSVSSGEEEVLRLLARTSMAAHILVLAYITDHLQELSPQFRHVFGKRNRVKEVFDDTFVQTISLLVERRSGADLVGELKTVSAEYREIMPGLAFNVRDILKSVNLMIMNVNATARPARPYSMLPVPSE